MKPRREIGQSPRRVIFPVPVSFKFDSGSICRKNLRQVLGATATALALLVEPKTL